MPPDSHIVQNLEERVFYHGTSLKAADSIAQHGFQVWVQDEDWGRYARAALSGSRS